MPNLKAALKLFTLNVAAAEGWRNASVRVYQSRKTNRVSVHIAFSGDEGVDYNVESTLAHAYDVLRSRQTPDVQAVWPTIVVESFIMISATWTGTTRVTME